MDIDKKAAGNSGDDNQTTDEEPDTVKETFWTNVNRLFFQNIPFS